MLKAEIEGCATQIVRTARHGSSTQMAVALVTCVGRLGAPSFYDFLPPAIVANSQKSHLPYIQCSVPGVSLLSKHYPSPPPPPLYLPLYILRCRTLKHLPQCCSRPSNNNASRSPCSSGRHQINHRTLQREAARLLKASSGRHRREEAAGL